MKSKLFKKVMSCVLCGTMVLSSAALISNSPVYAELGYWPEDLPISNEYYHENETLQPYGACFLIDELKNWTPDNDPDARYNRGSVPLQKRWMGPNINPNASRDAKVMPLGGTSARASQGPSQGGNEAYSYAFTNFQYVDNYNYWGGSGAEGPIAIPTPEHIDSSHRNGVKATGTIFIPWGDYTYGNQFIDELTEKKADGTFPAADKLIEIAQYYGFDGYIFNQESGSTPEAMARFKDMLAYVQKIKPDNFVMSWYNGSGSLNDDGIKNWLQDGDTRINDEWWLDMSWGGIDGTIAAARANGRSPFDIHASWENFPYTDKGGSVDSLIGSDKKLKVSLGILGPGSTLISSNSIEDFMNRVDPSLWTGPTNDPRNTERSPGKTKFCGFSSLIADQTPIIGDEFVTHFTAGNGYKFYENGVATGKQTGWYNRSLTDVMPTWRWIVDSEGSKLTPIIDYATAWWGGTSLKVSGNLDANKPNTIRLYSSQLDIKGTSKASITYKTPKDGVKMSIGLCFGDNYDEANFKYYPVNVTANGEWATSTVDLSSDAGKKAIAIALKYESENGVTGYTMNVGRMAFTTNDVAPAATSKITLDESIYINDTTAEARVYWEKANNAALYTIHRVHPDGKREFIGATPSDAFYLGKFSKDGSETNFDFEITSYNANGTKGGTQKLNFRWPSATNGFEDPGVEGINIAFKAPAVDDGSFDPGGKIDKINDGVIPNSKWCSTSSNASAYLDLGKEYDISRWVVKHANVDGAGEGVDFNTVAFNLQYAPDDKQPILNPQDQTSKSRVIKLTYTKADEVSKNKQNVTDRILSTPIKARYIKLNVTDNCSCPWRAIRIYEFELYENAFYPHSPALLERNVTVSNKTGGKDTAVFNNIAMPIGSSGSVSEDTGIVKIYDSLTAETPIAQAKATQPNEVYKQRHRGIVEFTDLTLKPEGGRLYYTTQQNGMVSLRYSVEYGPETGTAIKAPTSIKLEHSLKGNQTRSKYGVFTLTGLDVGTTMKIYECADSKSPILHARPVQDGEDFIRQERVPLSKDGGKIYYELKQSGKADSGRLEYTYGPTDELIADQASLKDLVSRYDRLQQSNYIPATWTPFAQALANVKALIGTQVKAGDAEVKRAVLEQKAAALRSVANLARIKEVCAEYETKYTADAYSVKSFTRFSTALNDTKAALSGDTAYTVLEVEKMRIKLDDAVTKLVLKGDQKVNSVTVTPNDLDGKVGTQVPFTANVSAAGEADDTVTWEVTGNTSTSTTIASNGILNIGADETIDGTLTIKATSVFDNTKFATAKVLVVSEIVPKIISVVIPDNVEQIEKGLTKQFTANVVVKNNAATTVTWTVENAKDAKTIINNGLLMVSADETASEITIKATSTVDSTKFATKVIKVINPIPRINSISLSPEDVVMRIGAQKQFSVVIDTYGGADSSVTWSVGYNKSANTQIDQNGLLTVGADETASYLQVKVASNFDKTKKASTWVDFEQPLSVTFANTNLPIIKLYSGDKIAKPADAVKPGYKFVNWYADEELTTEFVFDTVIDQNTTIYAKFTANPSHNILTSNIKNGSVVVAETAKEGEIVAFSAKPDTGYILDSSSVKVNNVAVIGNIFVMPAKDAVITMNFVPDKAPLTKLYELNKDKQETAYTTASWSIFKNALATAKKAIESTKATVATLATAYNNLDSAVQELVLRGDKASLKALYDANQGKVAENYTESTWNAFNIALDEAKKVLDNADAIDEQVKAVCNTLDTAIKGLIGNKTSLLALYNKYKYYENFGYTQTSWSQFTAALEAAKVVLNTENATYEDILVAYNKLDSSFKNLVFISTRDELLADYNKLSEYKESNYSKSSWPQFTAALDEAKLVLDTENVTVDQISIAKQSLWNAQSKLVFYADRKKLKSYYDDNKDLNEVDYTADSWVEFKKALDAAKAVIDRDNVLENEFCIAYDELFGAVFDLIRLDMKVELEKMYNDNIIRNETDYTAESWAIFEDALNDAKAVIDDPSVLQYKVDEVTVALESAIKNLVKKPVIIPSEPTLTEKVIALVNDGTNSNVAVDLTKPETISKDILKAAKEQKRTVTFNVVDSNGKLQYSWTIDGKNVNDIKDVNLELKVSEMKANANIQKAANNENGLVLSFSHSGSLPTNTQVKVYVGDQFKDGDKLYFYYFNEAKGQLEKIADEVVVKDGYATVAIDHCSDYVLTKTEIKATTPAKPTPNTKNPQTGDNAPIIPFVFVVLSGIMLVGISKKSKKTR